MVVAAGAALVEVWAETVSGALAKANPRTAARAGVRNVDFIVEAIYDGKKGGKFHAFSWVFSSREAGGDSER